MKKTLLAAGAVLSFASAFIAFQYLAITLFYFGLGDFYDMASTVPELCNDVVANAAVAFTGIFEYIAWAVAGVLFVIGVVLASVFVRAHRRGSAL